MNDKDFHKLIEEQDADKKAALYQKSIGSMNVAQKPKQSKMNYRLLLCGASAAALVCICLIIIVPLLRPQVEPPPIEPPIRYQSSDECIGQVLEYSIKDCAQTYDKELLYIDWYDIAEDRATTLFKDKNEPEKAIYIEENLVNLDIEVLATLYVMDIYTKVDVINAKFSGIFNSVDYNGVKISYHNNDAMESFAYFEYNGYCYYIWLQNLSSEPYDEQLMLDITKSMLP